jgi:hypothetical protein
MLIPSDTLKEQIEYCFLKIVGRRGWDLSRFEVRRLVRALRRSLTPFVRQVRFRSNGF